MSDREKRLVALIDRMAASQTAEDRAYLRESLAYGNLKLEDSRLTRSQMADAATKTRR